ncbi:MAG: hypothetical protein JWR35_3534 [Marmoricola sp.]|jgi:DNA-binding GntR family transcriptional regulator|nr:hypothetical protein [Marmoricola sp.]
MQDAVTHIGRSLLSPLPSPPSSRTDLVFDKIKEAIVDKTLAPGSRVTAAALAVQLNVSRTPVRDVLLRLKHIGLVVPSGDGLRVIEPSRTAIRDAYELRAGIERSAAFYAAQRVSTPDIAALLSAAEQALRAAVEGDGPGFRQWDHEFHATVARAAGNPMTEAAVADALLLTSVLRERDLSPSEGTVGCAQEHIEIAQAISDGKSDLAASAMDAHIQHVAAVVVASFPPV